jgi:predicted DCC family thiol-disulfide oxidoreductase YuxK
MSKQTYPMTVYYDASCQLCNGEMSNLMLRNTDGLLVFVDASPVDFISPVPGATRHELMNMIHAVQADGTVVRGVEVFRLAYGAVGLGWVTAPTTWPVLRQLADRAYPWLVRNRYRIPRPLVHFLFEGATRRAAETAHQRARCNEQTCQR